MPNESAPPTPMPGPPAPGAPPPPDVRQAVGVLGEALAARWLEARGWTILDRRFRSGHRDLDLVARWGEVVAFVEVKARRGGTFGSPLEAVTWRKRRELVRSAEVWISRHGVLGATFRFDVVGVLLERPAGRRRGAIPVGRGPWRVRIRHVAHAFERPASG